MRIFSLKELINAGGLPGVCNKYGKCPLDLCREPLKTELIGFKKSLWFCDKILTVNHVLKTTHKQEVKT